jgi:peroxiredoxin
VELQKAWPELEERGVAVFGLSYDAVDVLARFAKQRGITFPLLSDEGSHAIRELGLLNQHVAEQHAFYGVAVRDEHHGVPYPGTFVMDDNGVVTAKYFEQSYRVRPTAALFREFALGSVREQQPGVRVADADLEIQAWTDSPTYRPYQQLRLHVRLDIPPGSHVVDAPLRIDVAPMDDLVVGATQTSAGHRFRVEGLDEELTVHTDRVQLTVPFMLTKNLGRTELQVRVGYQSCTETMCAPPRSVGLTVPLEGLDLIRD